MNINQYSIVYILITVIIKATWLTVFLPARLLARTPPRLIQRLPPRAQLARHLLVSKGAVPWDQGWVTFDVTTTLARPCLVVSWTLSIELHIALANNKQSTHFMK